MSAEYVVRALVFTSTVGFERRDTFEEALRAARHFRDRYGHRKDFILQIYNDDRCDYATDTGWNDGLTEEEREAVEALEWEPQP